MGDEEGDEVMEAQEHHQIDNDHKMAEQERFFLPILSEMTPLGTSARNIAKFRTDCRMPTRNNE